jgi:hypothetical protein
MFQVLIGLGLLGLIGTVILYSVKFDEIVDDTVALDPENIRREDVAAVLKLFLVLVGVLGGRKSHNKV